jgi:hypothetical protein
VNAGATVVVVVAVLAVVVTVAWFLLQRKHPERAASHAQPSRTGSALHHGDVDDRPAGPGAEADGVAGPGEPAPGPTAEGRPG